MHHTRPSLVSPPRKVRLWPGLRLELCEHSAEALLTPDEALGLANSIILNAREALYQAAQGTQPAAAQCPGLTASATPDAVTVSLWNQGAEMVSTLNPAQAAALAKTITSRSGSLQINCPVHQLRTPFAS